MRLSFSQIAEQKQVIKPALSIIQRQSLRQEIAIEMQKVLFDIQEQTGFSPPDKFDIVLQKIVNNVDPEVGKVIVALFNNHHLRKLLFERSRRYAVGITADDFLDLFTTATLKSWNNEVALEDPTTKKVSSVHIQARDLLQALLHPEQQQFEIKALEEEIVRSKESDRDVTGTIADKNRQINALVVANIVREGFTFSEKTMRLSFGVRDKRKPNGLPILPAYFRDLVVFNQLSFVLSERIQNRFANRFVNVGKKAHPKEFETAMMNSIAEFVMASMGVVHPELFALKDGEIDDSTYDGAKEVLAASDIDLDALMKKHSLAKSGAFYWNRWHVVGEPKLSNVTDETVREFLYAIRADQDEVLKALNFEDMIASVKKIKTDKTARKEDRLELKDELRELLHDSFSNEKFKDLIINLIKTKWYQHLSVFTAMQ
jgi:hypothetical protein